MPDSCTYAVFERFEIGLMEGDAMGASAAGACDEIVAALVRVPYVAQQLDAIDPEAIRAELAEYDYWEAEQLADQEANRARVIWIAAGHIREWHEADYAENAEVQP